LMVPNHQEQLVYGTIYPLEVGTLVFGHV